MPLGFRARIAIAVAVSAVASLIIAASFLKRKKRKKGKNVSLSRHSSLSCRSSNGPMQVAYRRPLISPQGGSPRAMSRLSRSNRSLLSKKSGQSSANNSLAGSVNSLASESTLRSGEHTPTNEPVSVQRLFRLGVESFESAIAYWEHAVDDLQHGTEEYGLDETVSEAILNPKYMEQRLQRILSDAYSLQAEYEETVFSLPVSVLSSSDLNEMSGELSLYKERRLSDSDNDSTTDSFVSATELAELEEMASGLESPTLNRKQDLYERALQAAQEGGIQCRRKRTKMLRCRSDEDFLAKVHCVRQAMAILLQDATILEWFISMGKGIIGDVLFKANYDAEEFGETFDDLMKYCRASESWQEIEAELRGRGVQFMSFYDIVLDFLLLDAFDDLESPPTSVTCITQNRWLSNRVKETALSTAVWSVLAAKRRMLQNPNGFLAKVYNISYHVTPALAWGFLGSDPDLLQLMNFFRDHVLGFSRDMFSLRKCRYTTVPELADDILNLARNYSDAASEKLST
ncbi:mitoguardin 2-like [Amphiura filiformis]|uniref:mitoguardin 2-like n=1 Tax=Amphiura filiformis TaxID=82378 RepID=UPI003B21F8FD